MTDNFVSGSAEYLRESRITGEPMTPVSQKQLDREAKEADEEQRRINDLDRSPYAEGLEYDLVLELDQTQREYSIVITDLFPLTGDEND